MSKNVRNLYNVMFLKLDKLNRKFILLLKTHSKSKLPLPTQYYFFPCSLKMTCFVFS